MKEATQFVDADCTNRHISIHAPVKGATFYEKDLPSLIEISIHAPVKGATPFGVEIT